MTFLWRDPRQKKKDVVELGLDPAIQTPEASWMPRSSSNWVAVSITDGAWDKDDWNRRYRRRVLFVTSTLLQPLIWLVGRSLDPPFFIVEEF